MGIKQAANKISAFKGVLIFCKYKAKYSKQSLVTVKVTQNATYIRMKHSSDQPRLLSFLEVSYLHQTCLFISLLKAFVFI